MGWRFRRSLKIAPGLHLNFGKRGISSLSVGVLFALGFAGPSRESLEAVEQRRIEDLARAELARRISTFEAAVAGLSSSPTSLDIKRVLATQHELGLTDSEAGPFQIEKL